VAMGPRTHRLAQRLEGRVGPFVADYAWPAIRSWDCGAAVAIGIGAGVLATDHRVDGAAVPVLLAQAGIGVALTSTVLAGLAVFATFFDGAYRTALDLGGGFRRALAPYVIVAGVSAASAVVGAIAALAMPSCGATAKAMLIALSFFFSAWALLGAISLTGLTAFHATARARLMRGLEDAREIRAERLKQSH
jgi:hypothetical protein